MKLLGLRPVLLLTASLLLGSLPQAHFLWLHLDPDESGRIEVLFGDGVYQDSDSTLVRYVEGFVAVPEGGDPVAFTTHRWGLSGSAAAGTRLLGGHHDMGLFQRPGSGSAVKLDYSSKAAATLEDAGRPLGHPAEIIVRQDGQELAILVLLHGAPAPSATVYLPRVGVADHETVETDERGLARIPLPGPGLLDLRAKVEIDAPGTLDGEKYVAEHHYAMLTVSRMRPATGAGIDLDAWQRLELARSNESRLPADVAGLGGVFFVEGLGERLRGEFEFLDGTLTQCDLPGAGDEARAHVAWHLTRILRSRFSASPQGLPTPTSRLMPRDAHPLGREIRIDQISSARVLEDRMTYFEETVDGRRTSVTYLDHEVGEDGYLLPKQLLVSQFDAATGAHLSTEAITETHRWSDGLALPSSLRIVRASNAGDDVMTVQVRNIEILSTEDH